MSMKDKAWYSRLRKWRSRYGIHAHGHNAIPLLLATFLFFAIALTQYYYASVANSAALKADSISMFADAISFFGAFLAEIVPSGKSCPKDKLELTVSGISLLVLCGFTIQFLVEAAIELQSTHSGDDVDGYVVLWFALAGILFDVASLGAYFVCGRHHTPMSDNPFYKGAVEDEVELVSDEESKMPPSDMPTNKHLSLNIDTSTPLPENELAIPSSPRVKQHIGANMRSALLHLISDSLRSITTLVEGIVLLNTKSGDSAKIDAVATLIVCSIIMVGVIGGIVNWIKDFKTVMFDRIPANPNVIPEAAPSLTSNTTDFNTTAQQ